MTRAKACQYIAEMRLRKHKCGDCAACRHKETEATVIQITNAVYDKPSVSLASKLAKHYAGNRPVHAMEALQQAADFLQSIDMHKTLPKPVMTSSSYTMTPAERAGHDEYVQMNNLAF